MREEFAVDEQTKRVYKLEKEKEIDILSARVSIIYSIVVLFFLLWLLFDIWYKEYTVFKFFSYNTNESLNSPLFRLVAFTFIGGCLGGTIASIRGIIYWHCEIKAFGGRFIYKHLAVPWIGGTLALFVFAIIRSSIGMLGGAFSTDSEITRQTLSLFAIGVLSGYGSPQVYKWIDSHVNRLFSTSPNAEKIKIPDIAEKDIAEAEAILNCVGLKIGNKKERKAQKGERVDMIVEQDPKAGIVKGDHQTVDITIAVP